MMRKDRGQQGFCFCFHGNYFRLVILGILAAARLFRSTHDFAERGQTKAAMAVAAWKRHCVNLKFGQEILHGGSRCRRVDLHERNLSD